MPNVLNSCFYRQDLHSLAKSLLGKLFVRILEDGQRISGHIIEVEAYAQADDPASHSYSGKSKRNEVMFGPAGKLYVYFTYGIHYCCNVVSGPEGQGDAILIRAVEPYEGKEIMQINRYGELRSDRRSIKNLCNGPAKLTQAFLITKNDNGLDLLTSNLQIQHSINFGDFRIAESTRIGISKGKELKWRYNVIHDMIY